MVVDNLISTFIVFLGMMMGLGKRLISDRGEYQYSSQNAKHSLSINKIQFYVDINIHFNIGMMMGLGKRSYYPLRDFTGSKLESLYTYLVYIAMQRTGLHLKQ